jgi:hypothetical protein
MLIKTNQNREDYMEKVILILNGVSEGKTQFVEVAKTNGYWVWNLNHRNVLSMLAHKLGWNGERTKEYYSFIDEFKELANKYFDSENWYVSMMIDKFQNDEKVNVLVIHNCDEELAKALQEEESNCFSISIVDNDVENMDCACCKTLNCKSENYVDEILSTLNILTKDFVKKEN